MPGLFRRMAEGLEAKTIDASALTWSELLGVPSSRSGVAVNVHTSLKTMALFAGLRVISEDFAGLPFEVLNTAADGSYEFAYDNPVWALIEEQPNEWMTSFEFREAGILHAALTGNAHWYINRAGLKQEIVELIPLLPGRCRARQLPDCSVVYDTDLTSGQTKTLPRTDIMHLRGPSWDTLVGLDVMNLAREAIGLSIATEESHARLHANGVQPGGTLTIQGGNMDEKAKEDLRQAFSQTYAGVQRAFRIIVLDQAAKFEQFQMKGVDAQHLETRKYQVEDVCRAIRVFPQMIGHSDKTSTFASAEAFFAAHVLYTLRPWVRRHEGMYKRDLLAGQRGVVAHFPLDELLRGDMTAEANYYSKALGAGGSRAWMTQNEVRRRKRLNPVSDGNELGQASGEPTQQQLTEADPTGNGEDADVE